jgi:hypothetical protein
MVTHEPALAFDQASVDASGGLDEATPGQPTQGDVTVEVQSFLFRTNVKQLLGHSFVVVTSNTYGHVPSSGSGRWRAMDAVLGG